MNTDDLHCRVYKYVPVTALSAEALESLARDVRRDEEDGWVFLGLHGGEDGLELNFYKMVPHTTNEIQDV